MLKIKNLTVGYQGKKILDQLSLTIPENKLVVIIGPNGAGKSTLLKSILNLAPKKKGEIFFKEKLVKDQKNLIAYVEQRQDIDLSFPISVFEVVLLGTYPHLNYFQRPKKIHRKIAWDALAQVELTDFARRQISELSGGQLQRVFIARALAQQAPWLLLDEPFAGIDAASEKTIVQLLKKLRKQGKSILIVHHDLHKVVEYFDEVILLNQKIIAAGETTQVYNQKNLSLTYGENIFTDLGGVVGVD